MTYKSMSIKSKSDFTGNSSNLKERLSKLILKFKNEKTFVNSEAAIIQIVYGAIDYFDQLDSDFLGDGNGLGIPDIKADHFANNLYRLKNAIESLIKYWNLDNGEMLDNEELLLLEDIRTLIVHSGEQLSNLKSLDLKEYKDNQLGKIFKNSSQKPMLRRLFKDSGTDYSIEVWSDKHDKQKARKSFADVSYNERNQNRLDLSIYIKAADVRNIVLNYIADFLDIADSKKVERSIRKLPPIKDKVLKNQEDNNKEIDFDKIAELVSKDLRGGYIIENEIHYWNGYGLKKFLKHVRQRNPFNPISQEVKQVVEGQIFKVMSQYWDDVQNENIPDHEIPSLDIRELFSSYTPNFEKKAYLEGEKLFGHIVPYFNTPQTLNVTDFDHMLRFVCATSQALNEELFIEQSNEGIVCDYFVKSIQKKIDESKEAD